MATSLCKRAFAARLGAIGVMVFLLQASPALATTSVTGDTEDLTRITGSAAGDRISVTEDSSSPQQEFWKFRIEDPAGVTVSGACTSASPTVANCPATGGGVFVDGGDGPDSLIMGPGRFTPEFRDIHGGDGNDRIDDADSGDNVFGDAGDDFLDVSGDPATPPRGAPSDLADCGIGTDTIAADPVDQVSNCERTGVPGGTGGTGTGGGGTGGGGNTGPKATNGPEYLPGTENSDVLCGLGGDDTIVGLGGDDSLYGGPCGVSASRGGAGRVRAAATTFDGNDMLFGGLGNDRLFGGSGNDRLVGDAGRDRLVGGSADDRLFGGSSGDKLLGGSGRDKLFGDSGNDRIVGDADKDRLVGGAGNDTLLGGATADKLLGGQGTDRLFGGAGNDRLAGGAGNDRLSGGSGRDKLLAGPGNDVVGAADGRRDRVDCGRGDDNARVDAGDRVVGCESVRVAGS